MGHAFNSAASPTPPPASDSAVAAAPAQAAGTGMAEEEAPVAARAAPAFPVVGIGASAGGLAAFEAFFDAFPRDDDTGMAFVLVQHLSPHHKSMLVELLRHHTRMDVQEASDGIALRPSTVYVIPPNHDLGIENGRLLLAQHSDERRPRLTVDHFFESLAVAHRERAFAVVLSGTGSDGTLGVRAVKGEGGLVIAQEPQSAEYDGMPMSAIGTGMVDHVLSPGDMPAQLLSYARQLFQPGRKPVAEPLRSALLHRLCMLLRAQTGHDFSQYKENTLIRRIERRMALNQIDDPDAYLRLARDRPPELKALFQDLLIGVTEFFRDREAFLALQSQVLVPLAARKAAGDRLRVWVCGCSTGEEAYSIAMLLYEQMVELKRPLKVQIFATDIDPRAIEQARAGIYPASIEAQVGEDRLARFFVHDAQRGTYRIERHIRDLLVFSEHNVISDPPFSQIDLISCRNLLIYLTAALQRELLPLFHYALAPGGTLLLGSSEAVGDSAWLFDAIDSQWKLYARLSGDKAATRPAPNGQQVATRGVRAFTHRRGGSVVPAVAATLAGNLRYLTEKALLAHHGSAAVLVNASGRMLHILGRTGQFLEPAEGDAAMNVLSMAREGLKRELSVALHKVAADGQPVSYPGLKVRSHGHEVLTKLTVRPVEAALHGEGDTVHFLVVLEEQPDAPADPADPAAAAQAVDATGRIAELERELATKDAYLQTMLEEMDSTNEEMKSTNEEMQSVNEELQSTNEEMETSKEELQSVNEELSTVNAELQDKVSDLSHANNDMNNLLAGTGVGTVFVDRHLNVTRFTPSATQMINLIDSDAGRPLHHVATNFASYDNLVADVRGVLDTQVARQIEVQLKSGAWLMINVRPYRIAANESAGVVVAGVDITRIKKAEESLRRSEARLRGFIDQAYAGVSEVDLDGRYLFVNDRLCRMLKTSSPVLLGKRLGDVTVAVDLARVQRQLATVSAGGPGIQIDNHYLCADGSTLQTHDRVSAFRDAAGAVRSLLIVSFDWTGRVGDQERALP